MNRRRGRRCTVVEKGRRCAGIACARTYCTKHYERWRVHGDPLVVMTGRRRQTQHASRVKLLPWEIGSIREQAANGEKNKCLAKQYNVSASNIGRIVARITWADVY